MRGTPRYVYVRLCGHRITPAHAGNTKINMMQDGGG